MYNNYQNCKGFVYVVKDGDTLYKIAKEYDLRLIDVLKSNPYVNVYNLQPGDELCLPTFPNSTLHIPKPEANSEEEKVYVTQEGDTLNDLLTQFQQDYEKFFEYNPALKDLPIPVGTLVHIPGNTGM
jgi:LysM repeat protein